MIESRYKIEYVLPDEDIKKTSSFRVLWYLLLIPLVLMIVGAITYEFSIKDISRDSSTLLEKAKVHLLNLGDENQLKKQQLAKQEPSKIKKEVVTKDDKALPLKPDIETVAKSKEITEVIKPKILEQKAIIVSDETKNIKKPVVITSTVGLSAAQELQLKTIQEQIAKNTQLSKNLNELSEQLVLEQTKNQSLNARLAEEEKDRFELEQELYEFLEQSEDNVVNINRLVNEPDKNNIIESRLEIDEEQVNKDDPILLTPVIKETEDLEESEGIAAIPEVDIYNENKIEENVEISETDKIIEAMSAIAVEIEPVIEINANEKKLEDSIIVDQQEIITNGESEEVIKTTVVDIPSVEVIKTKVVDIPSVKVQIEEKTEENQKDSVKVIEEPLVAESVSTEKKIETVEVVSSTEETKPEVSSPIDDIIAAMKDAEADATNKPLNTDRKVEQN